MRRSTIILVFAGIALVAVVLFLLAPIEWPWTTSAKITSAVTGATRMCLVSESNGDQHKIELGLSASLKKAGAGGSTDVIRTHTIVDAALSGVDLLHDRQAGRDCMSREAAKLLNVELGISNTLQAPSPQPNFVRQEGYIYFEESKGWPTYDGPFGLPNGEQSPYYNEISAGTVLQAVQPAQLRSGPSGTAVQIRKLEAGECVRVIASPQNPHPVTQATSGGRLLVETLSTCPTGGRADAAPNGALLAQPLQQQAAGLLPQPRKRKASHQAASLHPTTQTSHGSVTSYNQSGGITAGQIGTVNTSDGPSN